MGGKSYLPFPFLECPEAGRTGEDTYRIRPQSRRNHAEIRGIFFAQYRAGAIEVKTLRIVLVLWLSATVGSPAQGSWRQCRRELRALVKNWQDRDFQHFKEAKPTSPAELAEAEAATVARLEALGVEYRVLTDDSTRTDRVLTTYDIRRKQGKMAGPRFGGTVFEILGAPDPTHARPSGLAFTHIGFEHALNELRQDGYRLGVDTTAHLFGLGGWHHNAQDAITVSPRAPFTTVLHELGHKDFKLGQGRLLMEEVNMRRSWYEDMESLLTDPRFSRLSERQIRIIAALTLEGYPENTINEITAGGRELSLAELDPNPSALRDHARRYTQSYLVSDLVDRAKAQRLDRRRIITLANGVSAYLESRTDLPPEVVEQGKRFLSTVPAYLGRLPFPDHERSTPAFWQPPPRWERPFPMSWAPTRKQAKWTLILSGGTVIAVVASAAALEVLEDWDREPGPSTGTKRFSPPSYPYGRRY